MVKAKPTQQVENERRAGIVATARELDAAGAFGEGGEYTLREYADLSGIPYSTLHEQVHRAGR